MCNKDCIQTEYGLPISIPLQAQICFFTLSAEIGAIRQSYMIILTLIQVQRQWFEVSGLNLPGVGHWVQA